MLLSRLLWDFLILFAMLGVVILPVLLPLNFVHGKNAADNIQGLDRLSWANVDGDHVNYYWAHMTLLIYAVTLTCHMVYKELHYYVIIRQSHIQSRYQSSRLSARTILITDIPKEVAFPEKLQSLLGSASPSIQAVWINRDYTSLIKTIRRRDKVLAALEIAQLKTLRRALRLLKSSSTTDNGGTSMIKVDSKGQYSRFKPHLKQHPSSLTAESILDVKSDQLNRYWKELAKLNNDIRSKRTACESFPPVGSAFVTFNDIKAAHSVCQCLISQTPASYLPQCLGTRAQDIIWKNIGMKWWERSARSLLAKVFVAILIIIWALPVAFTGFLSQISYVVMLWPRLGFLQEVPRTLLTLIQGVLPQALLMILTVLIPIILRILAEQQGLLTSSSVELAVQNYYFIFLFLQVFLTVSLSSSITTIANEIYHGFDSIPRVLAENLPKTSNYFFSYILLQGLSVSAGQILQLPNLVKWFIVGPVLDITPRAQVSRKRAIHSNIQWGSLYPTFTNLACIGTLFSYISKEIVWVDSID